LDSSNSLKGLINFTNIERKMNSNSNLICAQSNENHKITTSKLEQIHVIENLNKDSKGRVIDARLVIDILRSIIRV